jgi:predicted RecB family nuclease
VEGSKTIKEFVVADIKAARRVKLYHKVQVSMYIMLLREQFRLWSTSEV